METAPLLGAVYIALCVAILGSKRVSWLQGFLHYGKVKLDRSQPMLQQETPLLQHALWALSRFLDLTVPKRWFAHFYYIYAALLVLVALVCAGPLFTCSRYSLIFALLMVQAGRRVYECTHVTRWSGAAQMHVTHYMAGLYFYVATPVTCAMGLASSSGTLPQMVFPLIVVFAFALFSWDQYWSHVHLALLPKYSAPYARLFRYVLCPHYLDEMGIYACVTALACAQGIQCAADGVILCSMVFVAVNLGVSAIETNQYYRRRFPAYDVQWALVPWIL